MHQACLNIIGEHMKITKISLTILILICAMGIVTAASISDIKVTNGFEDLGDGSYTNDAENINIDIMDEKDLDDLKAAFENDSSVKYTLTTGKLNYTFNFTDGVNELMGVNELVKINDKEYVIEFTSYSDDNIPLDKIYDTLEEFNKINNLEPIDPSTLDN